MLQFQYNRQWLAWGAGLACALAAGGAMAGPDAAGGVVVRPESAGVAAMEEGSFIDPQLKMLWGEHLRRGGNLVVPADAARGFVGPRVVDGMVRIEALSLGDDAALADELRRLGAKDVRQQGNLVLGRMPVAGLGALQSLRTARFVRRAPEPFGSVGAVTSQGDAVQGSERARRTFGVDGSGVVVGVTSTGYDTQGGAATDVARGDLPGRGNPNGRLQPVRVLKDRDGRDSDEGRAMAQIIHDVAPGASPGGLYPRERPGPCRRPARPREGRRQRHQRRHVLDQRPLVPGEPDRRCPAGASCQRERALHQCRDQLRRLVRRRPVPAPARTRADDGRGGGGPLADARLGRRAHHLSGHPCTAAAGCAS